MTLSLIVPVYNVAVFLPSCLQSLAALDPAPTEIVVVDDGSTDDCPRILAEWAPRLPHMRVVRQPNGGLSQARNTGLDLVTGEYLAFVDSDDMLTPDAYKQSVHLASENRLDLVMFNGWFHYEGRERDRLIYPDIDSSAVCSGIEWMVRSRLGLSFRHYAPLNLYRSAFIEAHRLRFPLGRLHEDVVWTTEVLLQAQRVMFDKRPCYLYRQPLRRFAPGDQQRRIERIIASSEANARDLDRIIAQHRLTGPAAQVLSNQLTDGALSIFHKLAKMPERNTAAELLCELRRRGFLALLWRHAQTFAHRRRIARHWLRSWLARDTG